MFLKQETVNVLTALNTGQMAYQSILYDKKFIKTIMDDIFGGEPVTALDELNPRKVEFIKGREN